MENQLTCPHCKQNIVNEDYFCPSCGKKLKDKPLSTSAWKQILVYLLSILLPPLGLWPAVKYLKQKDDKSRMIGFIAVFLTIISIILTVWFTWGFMNTFSQQLNSEINLNSLN